ncbi:toll/interleukin-1 receptor domain-containing protein [Kushneria sp. TE3]|uniref:toll/interleukin-1 receptor domain-containing protein n=1 Tax=Kushneria sp. TE3 TaxID=3449832 RepID=UPI003F683DA9
MPSIFFSYSHADEAMRDQLEKHLSVLKRQGVIDTWHDRQIDAGQELDGRISDHVENDDIILLLVSPDFLNSDYCYDVEMSRAMRRHELGEAVVIPVILRPCSWSGAPFGKIMATPKDGLPISRWPDQDEAFLDVTNSITRVVNNQFGEAYSKGVGALPIGTTMAQQLSVSGLPIRSSNLRVSKQFTDRDKDSFRNSTFDYLANFFENSLEELEKRNPNIDGSFRKIDANRFIAGVYRDGREASKCTIFVGGAGEGIAYTIGEVSPAGNAFGYNECLRVKSDDQQIYLESLGMSHFGGGKDRKLSQEGAAELYWEMFIQPLQR